MRLSPLAYSVLQEYEWRASACRCSTHDWEISRLGTRAVPNHLPPDLLMTTFFGHLVALGRRPVSAYSLNACEGQERQSLSRSAFGLSLAIHPPDHVLRVNIHRAPDIPSTGEVTVVSEAEVEC